MVRSRLNSTPRLEGHGFKAKPVMDATLTPYQSARYAYLSWVLSLHVQHNVNTKRIPHAHFFQSLSITTPEDELIASIPAIPNYVELKVHATNLQQYTLGTCFMVFDQALDSIFGNKPDLIPDTNLGALRSIIYMMRCAIAHETSRPGWHITNKKYLRLFKIKEIDFQINFGKLKTKEMRIEDFGDFKQLWRLMKYALVTIEHEKDSA